MKKLAFLTILLGSTAAMAAQPPSAAECQTMWTQAAQSSPSLSQSAAGNYIASSNYKQVDTNSDGQISQSEFQAGCLAGLVQSKATGGN